MPVFMQLKPYFDVQVLIIFYTSTREESSLPMKHAKNYHIDFFEYEDHNP